MLGGYLNIFLVFFNLVEKKSLKNFLSVVLMAWLVYERDNCGRNCFDSQWLVCCMASFSHNDCDINLSTCT